MKRGWPIVLFTVGLIFVGGAFLKGFSDGTSSNPTASILNGAPRGLLGLRLLLARQDIPTALVSRFDDPPAVVQGHVVLVPPPERTKWSDAEAIALLQRAEAGDHVVILCDDDGPRTENLGPLLEKVGVECYRADVAIGDTALTQGTGVLPGYAAKLFVRGAGRVRTDNRQPVFPAWVAGTEAVVMKRAIGLGSVTVVGTATLMANDGLAQAENAAFALELLAPGVEGASVIFDERHHGSRSRAAVLEAAARSTGPITALAALLLLVPLSLLSLAPRPGDGPRGDDERAGAPAAEAQALALASLLAQAHSGQPLRPDTTPTTRTRHGP